MLDNIDDINDEKINRRKDKKLSKHFDILINDIKIKIVNFLIKDKNYLNREGKVIRLISKYNININDRKNVRIKINHNNKSIDIVGDWCSASWGLGQYIVEYWIIEIDEN